MEASRHESLISNVSPTPQGENRTDVMGRKIWDKEYYSRRAAEKEYFDDDDLIDSPLRSRGCTEPRIERRPLQERTQELDLEKNLGQFKVITHHTPKMQQGGYWCDVCECLIKDSQAFLDHVNGKRHNRLLGMTMRVQRVDVDKVRSRLKLLRKMKLSENSALNTVTDNWEMREIASTTSHLEYEPSKKAKRMKKKKNEKLKHENFETIEKRQITGVKEGFTGTTASTNSFLVRIEQNSTPLNFSFDGDDSLKNLENNEETRMLAALGLPTKFIGD